MNAGCNRVGDGCDRTRARCNRIGDAGDRMKARRIRARPARYSSAEGFDRCPARGDWTAANGIASREERDRPAIAWSLTRDGDYQCVADVIDSPGASDRIVATCTKASSVPHIQTSWPFASRTWLYDCRASLYRTVVLALLASGLRAVTAQHVLPPSTEVNLAVRLYLIYERLGDDVLRHFGLSSQHLEHVGVLGDVVQHRRVVGTFVVQPPFSDEVSLELQVHSLGGRVSLLSNPLADDHH